MFRETRLAEAGHHAIPLTVSDRERLLFVLQRHPELTEPWSFGRVKVWVRPACFIFLEPTLNEDDILVMTIEGYVGVGNGLVGLDDLPHDLRLFLNDPTPALEYVRAELEKKSAVKVQSLADELETETVSNRVDRAIDDGAKTIDDLLKVLDKENA
jgi:hypothetical protein